MNRIVARISNGLGNQMFLYAFAYVLSKNLNRNLELDIISGINSDIKKSIKKKFKNFEPKYLLNHFNITSNIASKNFCFDGSFLNIYRKFLIFCDKFSIKKRFIIEHRNKKKITFYKNYLAILNNSKLHNTIFIEGHFESSKYFANYKKELLKEFSLSKKIICNNKFENKILNSNSISIAFRADRYSEYIEDDLDLIKTNKTKIFEMKQLDYINRSINFFRSKISNPQFFIFSDNPKKIPSVLIDKKNIHIIDAYISNKAIEDFYLMSLCKHFAVGPTSFHFWPAWLSENQNKICVFPKDINPSNNLDFWPDEWIKI